MCPRCESLSGVCEESYGYCRELDLDFDEEPWAILDFLDHVLVHPMCPRLSTIPDVRIAYSMWHDRELLKEWGEA